MSVSGSDRLLQDYLRVPTGAGEGLLTHSAGDSVPDREFRLLAENLPTLCWMANSDGSIFWYNRRWYDYTGTTPQQMEGWGWRSVHHPEELPGVMDRWTASVATGEPFEMTFPLRGADGVYRPFLTRIQPVRDDAGLVMRWFGVNTDVSEQRAAEAALREREDLARRVLDGMAEGFVFLDPEFRVLEINAEGLRMEQRPASEIIGRTHWEAWPGSEELELGRLYKTAMRDRTSATFEHRYVWEQGHHAWLETRAYPSAGGLAIFYRDVTGRKHAESQLRDSQERLDLAVRTAAIGIFDWSVQTGRLVWSEQEERLYGLAPGEFQDDISSWERRVVPEDLHRMQTSISEAMARRDESMDFEFRICRADGEERVVQGSGRFIYAKDGTPLRMVGVNMDITERKRGQEHLRLMVDELNHRVKNNLATVQAIAVHTLRGTESLPQAREAFTSRLMALASAHDVLTQEQWEGAPLQQVARGVLDALCGDGARVRLEGPPVLLSPKGALSLAMAFHELATNACKYGPLSGEKGGVDVTWRVEAALEPRLQIRWTERGGPVVSEPTRRGFGSKLLERGLAGELRGRVVLAFPPEGLICTIEAPVAKVGEGWVLGEG